MRRCSLSTLCLGRSFVSCRKDHNCLRVVSPKIQRILLPSHPNIVLFVNELINVQVDTYIKIRSSMKIPKAYSSKIVKKQVFLQKHINKVLKNEIKKLEFVKIVSYHFRENKQEQFLILYTCMCNYSYLLLFCAVFRLYH
nr:unnamed protein product [Callosobruchus analis]